MKKVFITLSMALMMAASMSLSAQETNIDANGNRQYGPYLTNKFKDNWFIGAQGGFNFGLDGQDGPWYESHYGYGTALGVYVGKWFEPCTGFRIGYDGIGTSADRAEYGNNPWNFAHVDLLWNFSNTVAGYKENRLWNFIPFAQAGYAWSEQHHPAVGLGLMTPLKVSKRVDIVPEISAQAFADDLLAGTMDYDSYNFRATLGVIYNIGKNNWKRASDFVDAATYAAAQAAALEAANRADKLKGENDALKAANKELQDKIDELRRQLQELSDKNKELSLKGNTFVIGGPVLFDFDKSVITPEGRGILSTLANYFMQADVKSLKIVGHTDSVGADWYNQPLSERRANAVEAFFEKMGIPAAKMSTEGHGSKEPIDTNATAEGRHHNRRVEITFE